MLKLKWLAENPRGTHCGRATQDSIAYVQEIQRIAAEANDRR